MTVNYNATGTLRKDMVKKVSEALGGWEVTYLGAPTFSYRVGDFEIDRHGALIFDDRTDTKLVESVLEALAQAGFECDEQTANAEPTEFMAETTEEKPEQTTETNTAPTEESAYTETAEEFVESLSVSLPNDIDEHARHNLDAVISGKATLFKAAFKTENLDYGETQGKLTFPWFKFSGQPKNLCEIIDFV